MKYGTPRHMFICKADTIKWDEAPSGNPGLELQSWKCSDHFLPVSGSTHSSQIFQFLIMTPQVLCFWVSEDCSILTGQYNSSLIHLQVTRPGLPRQRYICLKKPFTGHATDVAATESSPGLETSQGHLPKAWKGSAAVTSQSLQSTALAEAVLFPSSYPAPTAAPSASPLLALLPGSSCCCSCLWLFSTPLFGLLLLPLSPTLSKYGTATDSACSDGSAWLVPSRLCEAECLCTYPTPFWKQGTYVTGTHCTPAGNGNNHGNNNLGLEIWENSK